MPTFDVRLWDIRKRQRPRRPYEFRWVISGRVMSRSFATKALANAFRSELVTAQRRGEAFDEVSGLPLTLVKTENDVTWLAHARAYAEMKWPRLAAKSRRSTAESLATVSAVLVGKSPTAPRADLVREALYRWAFNPLADPTQASDDVKETLRWLERVSVKVSDLSDARLVREALDACALTMDGRAAAATTARRKRAVFYNALRYAVELDLLPANPIDKIQWTVPHVAQTVDRRVVANPAQVAALLDAVGGLNGIGPRLKAFFACLYYAAMRPSEAAALRRQDCVLPAEGWGRLELSRTAPHAGSAWTDDHNTREERGLKRRARNATRSVPIPPQLVALLTKHLAEFGTAPDGRLFRGMSDGPLAETRYGAVWRRARKVALTPEQFESRLAARPYDLRHAGVSLWLNAGTPPQEVAARAGHSVAVLLRVYAACLDGEDESINSRITDALS